MAWTEGGVSTVNEGVSLVLQSPDLLPHIFASLADAAHLLGCIEVCRAWSTAITNDCAWSGVCARKGLRCCSRHAYRAHVTGLLFDASSELVHERLGTAYSSACTKKERTLPNVSWCFTRAGFDAASVDRVAWTVRAERLCDEMRIGFTNDRDALLRKERLTLQEEHAWLFSDGSVLPGVWSGGERLDPFDDLIARFRERSVVGVLVDFEADRAAWFVDVDGSGDFRLTFALAALPEGTLYPAVALGSVRDKVIMQPDSAGTLSAAFADMLRECWDDDGFGSDEASSADEGS